MRLIEQVEKRSRDMIKDCSVKNEGDKRILKVELDADVKYKILRVHTDSFFEFSLAYKKKAKTYTKYTSIKVKFLDNQTVKIEKTSTYKNVDDRTYIYVKNWIIKLKNIDFSEQIEFLKELAQREFGNCVEVYAVILQFKLFYDLLLILSSYAGLIRKYEKRTYTDSDVRATNITEN